MINFNEPPYMEKSIDYIRKAVENKKICAVSYTHLTLPTIA